jgi:hypothetical protein
MRVAAAFIAASGAAVAAAGSSAPAGAPSAAAPFLYPPRGWNSWFAFDVHLNDSVMRSNADALVRLGLAAKGFTYVSPVKEPPRALSLRRPKPRFA